MDIEQVRDYCLSLPGVTEDLFAPEWLSFRIGGKWFVCIWLEAPEPTVAVKLPPSQGQELREQYRGIRPAYHLNKVHWNDLYIASGLNEQLIRQLIKTSYDLVSAKLPKAIKETIAAQNNQ